MRPCGPCARSFCESFVDQARSEGETRRARLLISGFRKRLVFATFESAFGNGRLGFMKERSASGAKSSRATEAGRRLRSKCRDVQRGALREQRRLVALVEKSEVDSSAPHNKHMSLSL